jgi:hypothetical protein
MYENLCGNSVGGVELTFVHITFHRRAFDFFKPLHIDLTIFKISDWNGIKKLYPLITK